MKIFGVIGVSLDPALSTMITKYGRSLSRVTNEKYAEFKRFDNPEVTIAFFESFKPSFKDSILDLVSSISPFLASLSAI